MLYLASHGISGVQIGTLQAVLFLASVLAEIPTGMFGDRFGRRLSLLVGAGLMVFSAAGYLVGQSFELFLLLFLAEGLAMAFMSGSDDALLFDQLEHEGRGSDFVKVSSKSYAVSYFALGISTFLGGILQLVSWESVYVSYTVAMAIAFMLAVGLVESRPCNRLERLNGSAKGVTHQFNRVWHFCRGGRGRHLFHLILIWGMFDSSLLTFFMFNQALFSSLGLSAAWIASLYTVSRFLSGLGYSLAPKIGSKISLHALILISLTLSSLLMFGDFVGSTTMAIVAFFGATLVPGPVNALFSNFIHENLDSSIRASFISLKSMMEAAMASLLYLGVGLGMDHFSKPYSLSVLGILPIVCMVLFFWYVRKIPKEVSSSLFSCAESSSGPST